MFISVHAWTSTLGEELQCLRENSNNKDPYTVAVMQRHNVVGHILRRMLAVCLLSLRRGGSIYRVVTASRHYSANLPLGGLEVPCTWRFRGKGKDVKNVRKLFTLISKIQQPEVVQPIKKRKLMSKKILQATTFSTTMAIIYDCIELTMADRDITSGGLLSDKHINFAQALLKKQHRELTRLRLTLLLPKHTTAPPSLQVLYSRESLDCHHN